MNKLLPGITLKTIICCVAVSSVISYGTCALYLTVKANSARIFQEEKTHKFDQPRMNSAERSLVLQ
jgi:hypothetical protein